MSNKDTSGGIKVPLDFKKIFTNDDIYNIDFGFYKDTSMFRDGKKHQAIVYFQKNNSKGQQKFYDDDPEELRKRVTAFTDSI